VWGAGGAGSHKANEELLASYGFVVPDNPADHVALLLHDAAAAAAGAPAEVRCVIGRHAQIPPSLWSALAGDLGAARQQQQQQQQQTACTPRAAAGGGGGGGGGGSLAAAGAMLGTAISLHEWSAGKLREVRSSTPSAAALRWARQSGGATEAMCTAATHYRAGLEAVLSELVAALESFIEPLILGAQYNDG
jgi:hypothetical protein